MISLGIEGAIPDESPMQVDEPTLPSTQRSISVPDTRIQTTVEELRDTIDPHSDSDRIRRKLPVVWLHVNNALSEDKKLKGYLLDQGEFLANVERQGKDEFIALLKQMANDDNWKDLLYNDIFFLERKRPMPEPPMESIRAIERAWESDFKGSAADVLLDTISAYLDREKMVYARQTCIINSSGTGKSRMVDEVARKIITVPMCLREPGTNGYPPPDDALVDYFTSIRNAQDQAIVAWRLRGFLYALLSVLHRHLKDIVNNTPELQKSINARCGPAPSNVSSSNSAKQLHEKLALAFRHRMTSDQSFDCTNDYRIQFYDEVIEAANKFTRKRSHWFANKYTGTIEAGRSLWDFIDPGHTLDSNRGSRRPLVILAFDESHILTGNPRQYSWTAFSEMCHTLYELHDCPFFSLFLSTEGKSHQFSPETRSDSFANFYSRTLEPITEISFDALAHPTEEGKLTLDEVTAMKWISHLGRPLFAGPSNMLRSDDIVLYAQQKLLNRSKFTYDDRYDRYDQGILACLSVRFALEFNEDPVSRTMALTQVERHMRLLIDATSEFKRLLTLAGSEPLLAEAALEYMRVYERSPARSLARHSHLNCVDRGQRGELVAAMIIMQARDAAQSAAQSEVRWVSVMEFMQALLPVSKHDALKKTRPTSFQPGEGHSFVKTFNDYRLWFNHVIKIEDSDLINTQHLWKFITRGAMIICKDNQRGVDIVLPACIKDENLSPNSVTAILIQVKNDEYFGSRIQEKLFDGMDPFDMGLFSEGQTPRPVIRLVFALASDKPAVLFRKAPSHHIDSFTAFDIWCAGLNGFRDVGDDLEAYQFLMQRSPSPFEFESQRPPDPLEEETKARKNYLRCQMAALARICPTHD